MDLVKSFVLAISVTLFVLSCGQSSSTPNAGNKAASSGPPGGVVVSSPANVVAKSANGEGPERKRPGSSAAAAAEAVDVDDNAEPDLYAKNCMICHRDTGKGGKVTIEGKTLNPIDLTSAKVRARSDNKLLAQIKEGAPDDGMPAFKTKLSDDEIKQIIQHIRMLQAQ